jgi:hypothetical protein
MIEMCMLVILFVSISVGSYSLGYSQCAYDYQELTVKQKNQE